MVCAIRALHLPFFVNTKYVPLSWDISGAGRVVPGLFGANVHGLEHLATLIVFEVR